LEAQLSQAQLQALKMQLHPHFLFNTLNAIAGLVRTDKSTEAVNMLSGLSDLLRRRLDQEDRQEVTLREELDFVELYLDIQQVRFSDRLKVEMVIDPETAEAPVPNLILQPLVENAILHGVSHNIGPTSLVIAADHVGESLRLRVFNSGRPISGDGQQKRKSGIGLSNTRTRLQQLYGNAQNFELRNVDGGVEAVVNIPWRQAF
jgi:LytS/YehU family sensor histidine kinase